MPKILLLVSSCNVLYVPILLSRLFLRSKSVVMCSTSQSFILTKVSSYRIGTSQVSGSLFAPSQKSKKLSHHFRVCFELGIGILNVPRKIFLVVYEPILELQGLVAVEFQGKNCFKKMASNFSEIDCGFR